MSIPKKVLVCPLDWGLGHATRCIPIIQSLIKEGVEVIIAADNGPLALLKEEFPELQFIRLSGYNIRYYERMSMTASMFLQSPKIIAGIFNEHKQLKTIVSDHKIDCVISDNRYGLWNKWVYTVFITHQLSIKCPPHLRFIEPMLYCINKFFIDKYDACWVPDAADENNLSGTLSHDSALSKQSTYIGLLSRLESMDESMNKKKYDVMAIVSGPEPHRSLLLKEVLNQLKDLQLSSLIVAGEPGKRYDTMINDHVRLVSHLNAKDMQLAISQSEVIVCRAGYSSIMDLHAVKRKAILIPTPGQTEQEYLAQYLMKKGIFYAVNQKDFSIQAGLKEINSFGDFSKIDSDKKYQQEIKLLIQKLNG